LALLATVASYSNILNYEDQSENQDGWDADECVDGEEQSPIDVKRPEMAMNMTDMDFYSFMQYDNVTLYAYAANNSLKWAFRDSSMPLSLPSLTGSYEMKQLHFHWSTNDTTGSEHAMEGEKFGSEMHLVTSFVGTDGNTNYAVINRFFEVVPDDEVDDDLNMQMEKILGDWDANTLIELNLAMFFMDISEYLQYNGSFTTPDCDEGVMWVIIPEPLQISQSHMERMRQYRHSNSESFELVYYNVRDLQVFDSDDRMINWFKADDHDDDEESHDTEEEAKEHLECMDGEGIMYHAGNDHWSCDSCPRGEFGWKNMCHACPPGKSTVDMGSSYSHCIATRYIRCEMHESEGYNMGSGSGQYGGEESMSGFVCEREFCPCNAYEECEYNEYEESYGMCRFSEHMSGAAGSVTFSVVLVAACLAYFGL